MRHCKVIATISSQNCEDSAISTTYFLYGQVGLVAEYQSNGDFVKGYGYYPKTSYTTNPVYTLRQNGASYEADFYHNDHLATPQKLTNSTGTVSWAMESNAFGEVTIKTQTTPNNLRFSGQYADSEIGLSQNYFRDYAPNLGRYMENDPIAFTTNYYAYVASSPLTLRDEMGLHDNNSTKVKINCKKLNFKYKPSKCDDSDKCFKKAQKQLNKCNMIWAIQALKKFYCIKCSEMLSGECPGKNPSPDCNKTACLSNDPRNGNA